MRRGAASIGAAGLLAVGAVAAGASPIVAPAPPPAGSGVPVPAPCGGGATLATSIVEAPDYYRIALVPTRRVPGTGNATGVAELTFARSPFGVAISPLGTYVYELAIRVERLRAPRDGAYVAWVTTPDLDEVRRLGSFDDTFRLTGRVEWNKFLVVITLEPAPDGGADAWQGPVILRGISRSGNMHTLAGHGPFEAEPCVKYGYQE